MRKLLAALIVAVVAALSFVVGRATHEGDEVSGGLNGRPIPSEEELQRPSPDRPPRPHQRILRYFATVEEVNLPTQGVLGGTMVAGTIAFPEDFQGDPGETFYVVGSDGHLLETWTYEISRRSWMHAGTEEGYAPVDFEDRPARYDVYLWRPARYISTGPTNDG